MDIFELRDQIKYKDWDLMIYRTQGDGYFLQWHWLGWDNSKPNTKTYQSSRKWYISSYATKSEVIQTAFKAALSAEEHEVRERFTYKGQDVFNPHYDVEDLVELSKSSIDMRKTNV